MTHLLHHQSIATTNDHPPSQRPDRPRLHCRHADGQGDSQADFNFNFNFNFQLNSHNNDPTELISFTLDLNLRDLPNESIQSNQSNSIHIQVQYLFFALLLLCFASPVTCRTIIDHRMAHDHSDG